MDDQFTLAITFASDLTKQVLSLSTGLLVLTATFKKDMKGAANAPISVLIASWIILLISVIFGIWSMMTLTGILAPNPNIAIKLELGPAARIPAAVQLITFTLGLILIIIYACFTLIRGAKKMKRGKTGAMQREANLKED